MQYRRNNDVKTKKATEAEAQQKKQMRTGNWVRVHNLPTGKNIDLPRRRDYVQHLLITLDLRSAVSFTVKELEEVVEMTLWRPLSNYVNMKKTHNKDAKQVENAGQEFLLAPMVSLY